MIEYTINDNLKSTFGGVEANHASDDQKNTSIMHPLKTRDQNETVSDSWSNTADSKRVPVLDIQGAFRALEQLILHRQELNQLSKEIIKVYTDMLQIDGAVHIYIHGRRRS